MFVSCARTWAASFCNCDHSVSPAFAASVFWRGDGLGCCARTPGGCRNASTRALVPKKWSDRRIIIPNLRLGQEAQRARAHPCQLDVTWSSARELSKTMRRVKAKARRASKGRRRKHSGRLNQCTRNDPTGNLVNRGARRIGVAWVVHQAFGGRLWQLIFEKAGGACQAGLRRASKPLCRGQTYASTGPWPTLPQESVSRGKAACRRLGLPR